MIKLIVITFLIINSSFGQENCQQERLNAFKNIQEIEDSLNSSEAITVTISGKKISKNIQDAKREYNEALAKLVLKEGLIALGADLENASYALSKLSSKDLIKAQSILGRFENSLYGMEGLNLALSPNKDQSNLFKNLNYDEKKFSKDALKKFCVEAQTTFCKSYLTHSLAKQHHISKTLTGFITSYNQANFDKERDEDKLFNEFQEYLKIKQNKKTLSFEEYKNSEQMKKVSQLKTLLKQYEGTKNKDLAKRILTLSKALEKIEAPFNRETSLSNMEYIKNTSKELIEKNYTELISASNILDNTNPIKENLQNSISLIKADAKAQENKVEELFDKDFSEHCDELNNACIAKLKKSNIPMAPLFINEYNNLKSYKDHILALKDSKKCLENFKDKTARQSCIHNNLKKNQIDISSSLLELKEELRKKERQLAALSKSPEIVDIEKEKMAIINHLYTTGCLEYSMTQQTTICKIKNNDIPQGILTLSGDTKDIILRFKISELKKNEKIKNEVIIENKKTKKLLHRKKTNVAVEEKRTKEEIKQAKRDKRTYRRNRRQHFREINRSLSGGVSSADALTAGLGGSLVRGVPYAMNILRRRQAVSIWADHQKSYHQWYLQNAQNMSNYYNQNGLYMNWGYNSYDPTGASLFNAHNINLYYSNSAHYPQYTYSGNQVLTGTTNISTSTALPTAHTTDSGQFSFSF